MPVWTALQTFYLSIAGRLQLFFRLSLLPWINLLPVVLHADHYPGVLCCFGQELRRECADVSVGKICRGAVGVFALRVVVENEHHQARAITGLGPFEHLGVA